MLGCLLLTAACVTPAQTELYFESFDGDPATPTLGGPIGWDVAVHSRDTSTFLAPETMLAAHGTDCAPPPALHVVDTYAKTVFQCKNHLMTSLNAEGYAVAYLTPDRMVKFGDGEAIVQMRVSTLRTSTRDWWDIYLSPWEDNMQLALEDWLPDLHGQPRNAVHIKMDTSNGRTRFIGDVYRDWVGEELDAYWDGYEGVLTPDPKQRELFELRISRTHLKFGMPEHDLWWIDQDIPALDWDRAVLQLGHHSYNPTKDPNCLDGHDPSLTGLQCGDPNTWHWDDLLISHAQRFSITRANRPLVQATDVDRSVLFDRAALPHSWLRFSAVGAVTVQLDGGPAFAPPKQLGSIQALGDANAGHFSSYWMRVPSGTKSIVLDFAEDDYWVQENGAAKDFALWSLTPGIDGGLIEKQP